MTDDQNTAQDAPEVEEAPEDQEAVETPEDGAQEQEQTFSREYVQQLRDESAKYRQRARRADDLAAALWTERVTATGRLADPTDLPMPEDADPLDGDALTAAVDTLLERKPHLASRTPQGDVGQGASGGAAGFNLAGLLRAGA